MEGIVYSDIFSHVAKLASIIFSLSLVATYDFEAERMDAKTNFLFES